MTLFHLDQFSEREPCRRRLLDPRHRLRVLLRGVLLQPGRLPQAGARMDTDQGGQPLRGHSE